MLKLGSLQLDCNLILAPMAGITDYPYRRLAEEYGCGLAFTEMVSATGLIRKGRSLLRIAENEHPVSVQLFGSNPQILAEAAEIAEAAGADAVDINMGCPAEQVVKTGAGAELMRSPDRVKRILTEVRRVIQIPLTIKIRSGWDQEQINAVEISKTAEDSGIDAMTIHPRTKAQGFRGRADWNLIGDVKRAVKIPVIGNGDVTSSLLAKKMQKDTGCDAVMIGRGALGNPWIFGPEESEFLKEKSTIWPSPEERRRVIDRHYSLLQDFYGEERALREIRRHAVWYSRSLPSSASFRAALAGLREKNALFEAISEFFAEKKKYVK